MMVTAMSLMLTMLVAVVVAMLVIDVDTTTTNVMITGWRGHRGLGACCSYQYMALPCKNPIYTKTCPPPRSGGATGPLTENGIRRGSALAKPGATVRLIQLLVLTECSHRPSGRQRRSGLRQQAPDFALALPRPVLAVWIPR